LDELTARFLIEGLARGTLATTLLAVAMGGCGDDGRDTASVDIIDNAFRPSTVRVVAGATVTWTWSGRNTHSVVGTFDGRDFNTGDHTNAEEPGFRSSHQFATAGTYEYVCGFHGGSMKGTVIVE
jgi:plastocyanin